MDKMVLTPETRCSSPENTMSPHSTPIKDDRSVHLLRRKLRKFTHNLERLKSSSSTPSLPALNYSSGYVEARKVSEVITRNTRRLHKRIIICCDGTWNNGLASSPNEATNVLKLSRCIFSEDRSAYPLIPQIVFYQTGLGTSEDPSLNVTEGATGSGVVAKIREAYAFISQNYIPGDEVFLFGFSRGAFTARTIASLITDIGILNTEGMEDFHQILTAYQVRRKGSVNEADADKFLNEYRREGRKRMAAVEHGTIKCVGVWDTVGAFGLPGLFGEEFNLLGFKDTKLSRYIKYAFHAMALHEKRKDFMPTKWVKESPPNNSEEDSQVLKQVWFSGSHSDVGGGYERHDLSDITLIWMVANLMKYKLLAIDEEYLSTLPSPQVGWGKMIPHDSTKGPMGLALQAMREFPTSRNETTMETIHQSVSYQEKLPTELAEIFKENRQDLVEELLPFESKMRRKWDHFREEKKLKKDPVFEINSETNLFENILRKIDGILDLGRFRFEHSIPSTNEKVAQEMLERPAPREGVVAIGILDQFKGQLSNSATLAK